MNRTLQGRSFHEGASRSRARDARSTRLRSLIATAAIAGLFAVGLAPTAALADETAVDPAASTSTPSPSDPATDPSAPPADESAGDEQGSGGTDPAEVTPSPEPSPTESSTDESTTDEEPTDETATDEESTDEESIDEETTPEDDAAKTAEESTEAEVGVLAVPTPGAGEAVITVRTGDTRSQGDPNSIAPLPGVQLGLFTSATGGTQLFACTADVAGDCSFVVTDTGPGGANRDREMYVRQISAPGTHFTNPQLRTGDAFGGDNQQTTYSFRVGALVSGVWEVRAGATYTTTPPAEFMVSSGNTNRLASGGVWQSSRNNPTLPQQCGLDIALVMDLSGSVNPSIGQARDAAKTLVNSLVGTPSRVGLFTFAASAPSNNSNNQNRPISPVSTQANADIVNGWIDGLTAPTNGTTNWDRGLYQVATSATPYDVLIILTDGNPTVYGTESNPGDFTRVREVENAIFSANAVKAENTRVVALGVGSGVTNASTALNLAAISGGVKYNGSNSATADYYQESSYAAAGEAMRSLALGNCQGSVSVVKQVVPPGGTTDQALPAGGWSMSATDPTAGIAIGSSNPANGQTDAGTGSISYPLDFAGGTSTGTVTIRETQQAGHTLLQQSGLNAACVDLNTGNAVAGVNNAADIPGSPGVVVPVSTTTAVSCTFYNQQPLAAAELVVNKLWAINGAAPVPNGAQDSSLTGNALVNGVLTGFGTVTGGLSQGQSIPVNESLGALPTLCTLDSQLVTAYNGSPAGFDLAGGDYAAVLAAGTNTVTITNSVTCPTRLTLLKDVDGDGVPTNLWTLDALTPPGGVDFPAGSDSGSGVTGSVTPGLVYPLAESGGDPRYVQVDNRNPALSVPGSTGSWACVPRDASGTPTGGNAGGLNGGVIVGLGTWVQCTAVNQTAKLTLIKEVVSGGGQTPAAWDLTAAPQDPQIPGLVAQTVKSGTQISIRPGKTYDVTESDLIGYEQQSLQCDVGNGYVDATSVTLAGNGVGVCRFINAPIVIRHDKVVVPGSVIQAADGTWTIQYRIDVSNTGTVGAPYALSDDLHYGVGNDLSTATYTVALNGVVVPVPWTGSGALATSQPLAAGATDVWVITVSGIVVEGPDLTPAQTACPTDDADGAFNNAAELEINGVVFTETACDSPSAPSVVKSGATASQQLDASWNVTYAITVSNTAPGSKPSYYSLSDEPGFPAGVTLNSYSIDGGAPVSPVPASIPVATDVPIAAGDTDVYSITINVSLPGVIPVDELECDEEQGAGAGFFNTAVLTSGEIVRDDDDCTDIEEGGRPTVVKDDPTVTQGGDGVWTLVYDLIVTGNAEFVSTYTLSDTLNFGGAISIVSASWTGEGGSGTWDNPSTTPTEVIVGPIPKVIGIDAVHVYTVTVTATVDPDAFEDPTTVACDATSEDPDVGFLNTATLTSAGVPQSDTGCGIPARPIIEKEIDGTVAEVGDHYEASYTITVTNSSDDQDVVYDLIDEPDFSGAVTITEREVTSSDVTVNPAWNGAAPTTDVIVEDQTLAGGDTHTFTVTVSFTVDPDGSGPTLLCEGEGGQGLLNTATVVSGGEWSDDACHDVPVVVEIVKEWVIDGGEPIAWDDPDLPAGFSAQGTIDGEDVDWGDPQGPYAVGDEVNVDETDVTVPDGCVIVNAEENGTGLKQLTSAENSFTVTNEAECTQTVTLEKLVVNDSGGTAVPADWTVSASGTDDGFGGPGVATGPVDLGAAYTLNEVSPIWVDGEQYEVSATWACTSPQGAGAFTLVSTPGAQSATLTVTTYGATVTCKITNTDIAPTLTLVKHVEPAEIAADFPPTLWTLSALDGDTPVLEGAGGADGPVEAGTPYTLEEFADFPEHDLFDASEWTCVVTNDDDAPLDAPEGVVTLDPGQDVRCDITNTAPEYDVEIVKSYELEEGETAVESGDEFEWVLTVRNLGDAVDGLIVTDVVDPALEVIGAATFDPASGWTQVSGPTDSAFEASFAGIYPVDAVTEIRIPVRMLPEPPIDSPPAVDPNAPPPVVPPLDESPIPNEACVEIAPPTMDDELAARAIDQSGLPLILRDANPDNNCDAAEVPVKRIAPGAYVRCIADVPWLYFDVEATPNVEPGDITVTWTSADGSLTKVDVVQWDERNGRLLWPGAAVDGEGIPYLFPGWRPITEADLADPSSVVPGFRFLDLILDEDDQSFPWRGETYTPTGDPSNPYTVTKEPLSVEFSVNPSQTVLAVYPQALPTCGIDRPPLLEIEKTSSVTSAKPGSSFEYTLQVTSTGLGAADPVTLFDEIPADLRVDAITTAPAPAFPRWENCAVTGTDPAGYGGSLQCDLLGVLGPNITAAPPVTLDVTLRPTSKATSIVNTGEVCYEDADGIDDGVFCADDSVTVTVAQPLPATGFAGGDWVWLGAGLVLLGGLAVMLTVLRRRRQDAAG